MFNSVHPMAKAPSVMGFLEKNSVKNVSEIPMEVFVVINTKSGNNIIAGCFSTREKAESYCGGNLNDGLSVQRLEVG